MVKLGPNRTIAPEPAAFEQVEGVLGNNAPSVRGFADLGDRAGLKYAYAAMGQGQVQTLQAMFAADAARAHRLRRRAPLKKSLARSTPRPATNACRFSSTTSSLRTWAGGPQQCRRRQG